VQDQGQLSLFFRQMSLYIAVTITLITDLIL
ncbi:MAG: hypothetical protein QG646_959, partial [Euryarchaeota archaeon]|nr:hypothetical protein [Euryarchaeota archaeon]